jgi:hypothetical protein
MVGASIDARFEFNAPWLDRLADESVVPGTEPPALDLPELELEATESVAAAAKATRCHMHAPIVYGVEGNIVWHS